MIQQTERPHPVWPVHPRPHRGELLSSWMTRLARANRFKCHSFYSMHFGRDRQIWNRDIDHLAPGWLTDGLSAWSGVERGRIEETTLRSYEGILFERLNPNGVSKWILPAGIYHRTRRRRWIVYCPLCLFEDEDPYFRRSWRLSLNTVCEKHGSQMLDACPECSAPVAYFRRDLGNRRKAAVDSLALCHQCGFDLRRAPAYDPPAPDGEALAALRSIVALHEMGWWFCGKAVLHCGTAYFDVLHRLATFLASPHGKKLLELVEKEKGRSRLTGMASKEALFELRPIETRHWLLVLALWLLTNWPDRFVKTFRQAKIPSSWLVAEWDPPYWFASVVEERLDHGRYSPTAEEARHAASYLAKQGGRVSATSVGRLIGSHDAKASHAYRMAQPRAMTAEEADRFFAGLDAAIRSRPEGSLARLLLERDRAIFWFMRLTGMSEHRARTITVTEALALAKDGGPAGHGNSRLESIALSYVRGVRPALVKERDNQVMFLASNGSEMCAEALRQRFLRAMKDVSLSGCVPCENSASELSACRENLHTVMILFRDACTVYDCE